MMTDKDEATEVAKAATTPLVSAEALDKLMPRVDAEGAELLGPDGLLSQAASRGLPARLQIYKSNPARKLYERLGFGVESETDHHVVMVAHP